MATLGLKEMGKFLWEAREKSLPCWLSQFSFASFFLDDLLNKCYVFMISLNREIPDKKSKNEGQVQR